MTGKNAAAVTRAGTNERLPVLSLELCLSMLTPAEVILRLAPGCAAETGEWLHLDGEAEGDYRVERTQTDCDTGICTARLRHGLATLADTVLPAEEGTLEGPFEDVLRRLLSFQTAEEGTPHWQPGEVGVTQTVALQPAGRSILELLYALLREFPGCLPECDQQTEPWTLNVRRQEEGAVSEARLSRNLLGAKVTYDASDICTRVLSDLLPDGYMDGEAAARRGIISREICLPPDASEAAAKAAAQRYLGSHAEPALTVVMDALALEKLTGEPSDRFRLGRRVRLSVPQLEIAAEERVIALRFPDLLAEPERVEVTLSNRPGGGEGGLQRIERETFEALLQGRQAERSARANAKRISRGEEAIRLKAEKAEVDDTRRRMSAAGISVDGAIAQVRLMATQQAVDTLTQRIETAEASIELNAGEIELRVERDGIISAINQTAESIRIAARHIELSGYTTLDQLNAAFSGGRSMVAEDLEVTDHLYVQDSGITFGASWQSEQVVTSISPSYTAAQNWALTDAAESGITGHFRGRFVNGITPETTTIYYLGR